MTENLTETQTETNDPQITREIKLTNWMITGISKQAKNWACGMAKTNGLLVPEMIEILIRNEKIRQEKRLHERHE